MDSIQERLIQIAETHIQNCEKTLNTIKTAQDALEQKWDKTMTSILEKVKKAQEQQARLSKGFYFYAKRAKELESEIVNAGKKMTELYSCSFAVTGPTFQKGHNFGCKTCGVVGNLCLCQNNL